MFKIDKNVRRLTAIEKKQYQDLGYVKNLPVFSNEAATELHNFYEDLKKEQDYIESLDVVDSYFEDNDVGYAVDPDGSIIKAKGVSGKEIEETTPKTLFNYLEENYEIYFFETKSINSKFKYVKIYKYNSN